MAKKAKSAPNVQMQFKGIELLSTSLNVPTDPSIQQLNAFGFRINMEVKVDPINRLLFIVVNISIQSEDTKIILGGVSTSCIFEILNFEEVIKLANNGKYDIPKILLDTLNAISLSTTRGVMYSTFRGTFLHNAILPIIYPNQIESGAKADVSL